MNPKFNEQDKVKTKVSEFTGTVLRRYQDHGSGEYLYTLSLENARGVNIGVGDYFENDVEAYVDFEQWANEIDNNISEQRKLEGKCPECGELGIFINFYPTCTKHGAY